MMKRASQEKPAEVLKNDYRNSIAGTTARDSSYSSGNSFIQTSIWVSMHSPRKRCPGKVALRHCRRNFVRRLMHRCASALINVIFCLSASWGQREIFYYLNATLKETSEWFSGYHLLKWTDVICGESSAGLLDIQTNPQSPFKRMRHR